MPSQVRRAAARNMSLSALSRSSEFIAYIDGIYYEGYAQQMSIENPARLTFEYFEFLRNL